MKFASVTQILIMAAVFCAALFGLDYWKNPQLWHASAATTAPAANRGVRLTLTMNRMCCTECLDDIRQALNAVPAIDVAHATTPKLLLANAQTGQDKMGHSDAATADNTIELPVTDVDKLDFVAIDRALREKGFVAARMELSGIEHFRLEATMDHFCCGTCDKELTDHIDFLKAKGAGGLFRWLDSVSVDHDNKKVVAYARYLQPGKTLDVAEFLAGLNDAGYAPESVHVATGEEQQHKMTSENSVPADDHIQLASANCTR